MTPNKFANGTSRGEVFQSAPHRADFIGLDTTFHCLRFTPN